MAHIATRRALLGSLAIAPVVVALPALASQDSHFQRLLREYYDVHHACETCGWNDDDPRFLATYGRLNDIERAFVDDLSASAADAKAKLRFMVDLGQLGIALDGDDAYRLVADATRFLL